MGMPDILRRIDRRLKALGLSSTAASLAAGLSGDAIRNWRRRMARGEVDAGMSIRSLEKLAVVLKTTVHWLQTGDEPPAAVSQQVNIRVMPLLSWDNPYIPAKMTGLRLVSATGMPETGDEFFALRIHDNAMNLVSPVDSIIFVNGGDRRLYDQGFYIISTDYDGVLYRQLLHGTWRTLSSHRHKFAPLTGPVTVIGRVLKTELSF